MAAGRIKGITIEIGGDTTKLTQALSKVDTALGKTKSNLRDIEKALKLDPSNTNLLKDRQQELAHAIEETKSRIESEKAAYEQLSHADRTPENVEKMRQLKVQIDLDTAALKELEGQAKQASSVLGSQFQAAGQKIQEVGEKIKGVGDKLSTVGSSITRKVTAPIVGGFAAAVKTTGDFDAAMSKVQAVSGATADEVSTLRAKAKEMGETTKFSASESAEALNYMAMAGWKTEDMLNGIGGIMNLAAASGEELGTTSDIVTDALTAFGYEAKDAAHFSDILASASSNANTNVAMMGESFKYAAPVAGSLGYSAEDVATALGLMANSGIKADMAGTSLRNLFNRMAKPTKESAMAMDRLGISLADDEGKMYSFRQIMDQFRTSMANINMPAEEYIDRMATLDEMLDSGVITQKQYDSELEEITNQAFNAEGAEKARAAAMLGGTRAMAGMLAIANASEEDYEKLTSAIDNSSQAFAKLADGSVVPLNEALESGQEIIEQYNGSAEAMSATMMDNLAGQTTILKSQIEALAISFGELLMPTVRKVVGYIQKFVDKLNSMDDAQKEQIIKIAAIVAAIGPALLIIGKVISSVGTIVSVVGKLTSIIGSVITGLGGLQGVLAVITGPIGIVIAAVGALVAIFVHLYKTNEEFRDKVNAIIESVKASFLTFIENLKAWIQEAIVFIQPIIESLQAFFSALGELFGAIAVEVINRINEIVAFIQSFIGEHQTQIQAFMAFIELVVKTKIEVIRTIIKTVLDVLTNIIRAFTAIMKGDWDTAWSYLKKAALSAKDGLVSIFKTLANAIGTVFRGIIDKFKQWGRDMIDNLIGGIKDKISAVKETMSDVAGAIREFIHFSEPDVGPLADFHTYAPDMMKEFAEGIRNNAHLITDAVGSSFDLRPYMNTMTSGLNKLTNIASNSASANSQPQPVAVQVVLQGDAQRLFRVLSEEAHRDWQITGQSRLMGY